MQKCNIINKKLERRIKIMGAATFKGGLHTYDGKELSKDKQSVVLMPKGEMIFPMSQHIGAPAKPLVAKGDYVLMGQKIGEASGFISANIISSVSGTVKAVEPRLTVSGTMVESIVIENDNEYKPAEGLGSKRDFAKLSKDEIRSIVKEAGIVGLGGAAFPTNVKLSPKDDNKIEYVLINAAECEPYLTSDYRLMLEQPEKLINGLKIELSLFPNAKGIIVIEDNKPEAVAKLSELVKDEEKIQVMAIKTKYPQGGERFLIYAVTGRKINSKMLPMDVGCVVSNVATAIAIYDAVALNTPLMERMITVTGDSVANPGNFVVKNGTNYSELLEAAGGFSTKAEKIISGGPMMGQAMFSIDVPVAKNTSGLLCLAEDLVASMEPSSCIRCGRCVEVCPGRVVPQKMYQFSEKFDKENFLKLDGMECCECGSCSYVCPAKLRLTQSFKQMRKEVIDSRKK
jgi:electron transport complex protein RnfC